ncbi:MAG: T9SS type A sorting domain-containing protein, partial [Candidatus Kapabacteria bacterium]|nr:T9SS type A sorting domain-containing protein [Candidatus Kapabacteria bacterium]
PTSEDNVPMQYDFRSVYSTILRNWFCVDAATTEKLLFRDFGVLDVLTSSAPTSVIDDLATPSLALRLGPNPSHSHVTVAYEAPQGAVTMSLFDGTGQQIMVHTEMHSGGTATMGIDVTSIPSGQYYVRIGFGGGAVVRPLVVAR